jgi:coniferyl-aldehyde dehydrogenase
METQFTALQTQSQDSPFNPAELPELCASMRAAWQNQLPSFSQRQADLLRLKAAVVDQREALCAAVSADFGRRSRHETLLADVMMVLEDIKHTLKNLKRWMRAKRVWTDFKAWPASAHIEQKPLGIVGILAPWNYPIQLSLAPLVAAIAAGNHVILKPSEHTPRTSALLAKLLHEVFPAERVRVVLGGPELASAVCDLPLDHLFFTGSTAVGKLVMAAAAKHLTPVTLELGGKSPCVIAPDFPIEAAVQRIVSMKHLNAGQTCIAPDYVFVPEQHQVAFVAAYRAAIEASYPNLASNPDYTSVVNTRQAQRLRTYLQDASAQGAEVVSISPGGAVAESSNVLAPTLVLKVKDSMQLMQDEIFGPILPIMSYQSIAEVLRYVQNKPRPLAFYLFDRNARRTRDTLAQVTAGGVTLNDCALHITQHNLPFGGVGPSGMGHYHGHAGFLTFTKQMPVFKQARWSGFWLLKPPFRGLADRAVDWLTRG